MPQTHQRCFVILLMVAALGGCATSAQHSVVPAEADCHAPPDDGRAQYIVGYGSLMQDESRKRTSPEAGPAHPVEVRGFRRRWIARSDPVSLGTTFLGVSIDAAARMNAVAYRVDASDLAATDRREASYCRRSVPLADIRMLEAAPAEPIAGQAWIYVNQSEAIATPDAAYPIVQSYVDIFVSGCLEQEQRFELAGFAEQCLATTSDWSAHWVNDRPYPRRAFIAQPRARQIDALLAHQLPQYFSRIRIE